MTALKLMMAPELMIASGPGRHPDAGLSSARPATSPSRRASKPA